MQPTSRKDQKDFKEYLHAQKRAELFLQEASNPAFSTTERFRVIRGWLDAFVKTQAAGTDDQYLDEAVCLLLFADHPYKERPASDSLQLEGLKGTHAVIGEGGKYLLHFHSFQQKMQAYFTTTVPAFRSFNQEKEQLTAAYRQQLKIREFEPKVLSSFVRNRLISEVYFP